ncbi:hypothetical protein PMG11_01637 [Penicillium brasilianum]|uniref:F-box domain-containing protein n=1 Tax=Penicillium brasilianum TaxID=104259 RepID=A0A0F7TFT5_PENBI|nr:hypothetical protein PMG11_01637 [Penicillium brasilianum]
MQAMAAARSALVIPRDPTRPTFLDLPFNIRERIYKYAGLSRHCPLDLNVWSPEQRHEAREYMRNPRRVRCMTEEEKHGTGDCDCFLYARPFVPVPVQLLRVARTVSAETSELLYSKNRFHVSFVFPKALRSLKQLNPAALGQIQSLKVTIYDIDQCAVRPWQDIRACSMDWDSLPLDNFELPQRRCKWLPGECEEFFTYLSKHVQESRLKLSLVCDVRAFDLAKRLTDPVQELPVLKEVAIRLNSTGLNGDIAALRALADDLANHLTDKSRLSCKPSVPQKPFRFMDLPTEIRIKILEQTELVAPGKLVWHSLRGFNCDRVQDHFHRCGTCQIVRDDHEWYYRGRCPTILARRCECWKFPISLFLVNHDIRRLATEVFYSRNHFEVVSVLVENDYCDSGSFLLPYLQENALRSLRKISLHIPQHYFWPDLFGTEDEPKQFLEEVFETLRQKANLERLKLMIILQLSPTSDLFWLDGAQGQHEPEQTQGPDWERFKEIAEPLRQMREEGLMRLYVEFRVVYPHSPPLEVYEYSNEAALERYIMGKTYNSMEHGKREFRGNGPR